MQKFQLLLLYCILFISCEYQLNLEQKDSINLNSSISLNINNQPSSDTISFKTNTSWQVEISESNAEQGWLQIEPLSGDAGEADITLQVDANLSSAERASYITIKAGSAQKRIFVHQAGGEEVLVVNLESQEVSANQGSFQTIIDANTEWSATNSADWISIEPMQGDGCDTICITYKESEETVSRSTNIIFTSKNGYATDSLIVNQLAAERDADTDKRALISFFQATNGSDWYNSTNWCSDKPLGEWYGVVTDQDGRVTELNLPYNGIVGEVKSTLNTLDRLKVLDLNKSNTYIHIIDQQVDPSLTQGDYNSIKGYIDLSKNTQLKSIILNNNVLDSICGLEHLKELEVLMLYYCRLKDIDISHSTNLKDVNLRYNNVDKIDISNLSQLESFCIDDIYLTNHTDGALTLGEHPKLKELYIKHVYDIKGLDCSTMSELESLSITYTYGSTLSIDLQNQQKLRELTISNHTSLIDLNIKLSLYNDLELFCIDNCTLTDPNLNFISPSTTQIICDNCALESINIENMIELKSLSLCNNKLTHLSLPNSSALTSVKCSNNAIEGDFEQIFQSIIDNNLTALNCYNNNITGCLPESLSGVKLKGLVCCHNKMTGVIPSNIFTSYYFQECNHDAHENSESDDSPHNNEYSGCCVNPQKYGYGLIMPETVYKSTDYSMNGVVEQLQRASVGKGVDVVFMGDGFTDKDIKDGTYKKCIEQAAKYFLAVEPITTYKEYFNLNMIYVVSPNSGIASNLTTALSTEFGSGTLILGDNSKVFEYAMLSKDIDLTKSLEIVVLNSTKYAGTCVNLSDNSAIAYCSMSSKDYPYDFRGIVQHEGVGHGLGKFLDEYVYSSDSINTVHINLFNNSRKIYNMGFNLTIDKNDIPWQHFLDSEDTNYNMVSLYEGGYFFAKGVWRAEQNNCMNNNVAYFNGPCRELIVKQIMSIAEESFSWDEFVARDIISIQSNSYLPTMHNISDSEFIHLHPPILIDNRR